MLEVYLVTSTIRCMLSSPHWSLVRMKETRQPKTFSNVAGPQIVHLAGSIISPCWCPTAPGREKISVRISNRGRSRRLPREYTGSPRNRPAGSTVNTQSTPVRIPETGPLERSYEAGAEIRRGRRAKSRLGRVKISIKPRQAQVEVSAKLTSDLLRGVSQRPEWVTGAN